MAAISTPHTSGCRGVVAMSELAPPHVVKVILREAHQYHAGLIIDQPTQGAKEMSAGLMRRAS